MNKEKGDQLLDLIEEYEAAKKKAETTFFTEPDFKTLIRFYEKEEEYHTALNIVEDALVNYPYSVDFYIYKAELLIGTNQEDKAIETLNEAALYAPGEIKIDLLYAEALTYLGHYQDAHQTIERIKLQHTNKADWAEIFLTESLIYECQEQYENMFYALKHLLSESPDNIEALERFWLAVELSKKQEESIPVFEEVIERHPYASIAWHHLGHANAYLGQYDEAIDAFEFAIVSGKEFEAAYKDCAELCFEIKDYPKALKWYLEILEFFEPDSDLFLRIGQCYQYLEQYALARTYLTRAMHLDHLNDEVYFHIGECFSNEKKWKSAINAYEKALKIEDSREEFYVGIAEAYYQNDDWEKAKEAFQKAIRIVPEEDFYWISLVSFLIETGQAEEGLETIEQARDYVDSLEITYCRIACLFVLGHRQEAYYWLSEVLTEDFSKHRLLFRWLPELEEDPGVIALLSTFLT